MIVIVIVIVTVVVIGGLLTVGGAALTGRRGRHSTTGLAVIPATVLVLTDLQQVVGYRHPQLRRKGRFVTVPVREGGPGTGLWV
jgi:hypothetical protein